MLRTTSADMNGVEFRLLALEQDSSLGALALITLTDPEQNGNALDTDLLHSLIQQLQNWQHYNIRSVILRSSSDIAFSVGMNFNAFQSQSSTEQNAASLYRCCLESIYRFPAPVFCLLEKPARAGGVGLVMAADLVIAAPKASLTLGEALFGLIPANIMPYLRKRISERRANQMVFVPKAIDAEILLQWGLVDFVTNTVEKTLKNLLRSVLRCNPAALTKQKAFSQQLGDLRFWSQQQDLAEETLAHSLEDPAVHAGISAFLDGGLGPWSTRPPQVLY